MKNAIVSALALSVALPLWVTIAMAEMSEAGVEECLRENIHLSAIHFGPAVIEDRQITVEFTNGTATTLGGVWISYAIWADDRPQPIYSASIRPAATIAGGLLPGESMIEHDFHFMSDREKEIARQTQSLQLTLDVENAADEHMNGFLPHPRMGSWSDVMTEVRCIAHES